MGRFMFRLPDIGEGVAEAEIVAWHVTPGDRIREDQSLVDVMTDKATVDMTSPVDGVVVAIHGNAGAIVPVGSVLVEFEVEADAGAEDAGGDGDARPGPVAAQAAPVPPAAGRRTLSADVPAASPQPAPRSPVQAPLASPSTRRRALERGIPLHAVTPSGSGGRITPDDLDAYAAAAATPAAAADGRYARREGGAQTRLVGLRRRIAERMSEAKRHIPHIAYVEECDVTELEALRTDLNDHRTAETPKLTLLPFIMRAIVVVVRDFPQVNAHFDDAAGELHTHAAVHIGIATQTDAGLMVPVVRHAEARDLLDSAREVSRLSTAARAGTAARQELSGSTITITSLGALGGVVTTPIINRPEVAIIGPNKIVERAVVQGHFVSVRKIMNLSCSFDHRIIDGYEAARFVQRTKRLLEHPALMFMD